MVEYPVACCNSEIAGTLYLTTGINGTVWFTENFGNAIGELNPAGRTAPVDVGLDTGSVVMGSSGSAKVSIAVTSSTSGERLGDLTFETAAVSRDGALVNLTATFNPSTLSSNVSQGVDTLNLRASGLNPGTYSITVGF